ncbi:MAG: phosphotransferase [Alphaproteobacteria bacterium]|nr:phosphotransferase [Alphaproteobacteria bacterium]MCB9792809.1 phosphotransferase [Alphaproteobacteria bacterium]
MSALTLAAQAARRAGLDPRDARVVRRAVAVLVLLPHADAVARVEQDATLSRGQRLSGRALTRLGAPTMRLLDPPDTPDALPVTLWERLDTGREPDLATLGAMTGELHGLHAQLHERLPVMDPVREIAEWFERLPAWLSESDRLALERRLAELGEAWTQLRDQDPLGVGLIHGDVHPKNVLWRGETPVFSDLESAGMGPRSWDLMPMAVHVRRYGLAPARYEAFLRAYGLPPEAWDPHAPRWPGYARFCELYELLCVIWTVGTSEETPALLPEARLRLDGWLRGDPRPWTLN